MPVYRVISIGFPHICAPTAVDAIERIREQWAPHVDYLNVGPARPVSTLLSEWKVTVLCRIHVVVPMKLYAGSVAEEHFKSHGLAAHPVTIYLTQREDPLVRTPVIQGRVRGSSPIVKEEVLVGTQT
jgi:hypothetical protein